MDAGRVLCHDRGEYWLARLAGLGARAALAGVRSSLATSKRHGTIYRRFETHLVQERAFDPSLGRGFLARQRRARQAADYEMGRVDEPTARNTVGEMQSFLAAVEPFLKKVKP